jgi:hypothetical protein
MARDSSQSAECISTFDPTNREARSQKGYGSCAYLTRREDSMTEDIDEGTDESRPARESSSGTDNLDTTMAAGRPSGAAGVANAELGTSGTPAENILSPEELAQVEASGGSGLDTDKVAGADLEAYFEQGDTTSQQ